MRYLKSANKATLEAWIETVYAGETVRTGMNIPQPGCSYGEPRQTLDGEWAIEIVPYAEAYIVPPYDALVVVDPEFPDPVDPFPLP